VKTGKEEEDRLQKEFDDKEKEKKDGEDKAVETHTDPDIPHIPTIRSGDT
jgi:hypothetical protein